MAQIGFVIYYLIFLFIFVLSLYICISFIWKRIRQMNLFLQALLISIHRSSYPQICGNFSQFLNDLFCFVLFCLFQFSSDSTVYWFGNGSWRISDLSLTNSFATSSLLRCDKIRNIVQPVSSICIRFASDNQRAHDPWK